VHPKEFVASLDHERITEAIRVVEGSTSGEIRVFIARKAVADPVQAAAREFQTLKMHRTRRRNAVLLFVAPASQAFAVIGDQGIHEKCGPQFWGQLAEQVRGYFKEGHFTEGIVLAVAESGRLLQEHFPRERDDENELPDDVVLD
jgi:uncharacterized membrane protein